MKRTIVALIVGLSFAGTVPAHADPVEPYQGEPTAQVVTGTVMLPTRFTDGSSGWPGLVRRVYDAAGTNANGVIGYVFPVDPLSVGGAFTLSVTGQSQLNNADLDIYFYSEMGDAAGSVGAVTTAEYATHTGSGETGFVAPDSRYGIVFMANGANVSFSYEALQAYGVEVSEAGYAPSEITVKAGAWVNFQNIGSDFHSATADDGSFDSSADLKHPLRPGDTWMTQFLTPGDYTFHDRFSSATGIVHVVAGPGAGPPSA